MNKVDRVCRASQTLTDSIKDNVVKNLYLSVKSKNIALDENSLNSLIKLIEVSVNEGQQLAIKNFQKTVNNILND